MFFFSEKCPNCGHKGTKVENDTMIHHVKDISKIVDGTYSFCHTPQCDIVYFCNKDTFTTSMVNKEIGFKDAASEQGAVCFCYNYLKSELYDESLIDKINIRIDNYGSRCDLRNPTGKCCLKDIKRLQKEKKEEELHDIFKEK